ncbi:olfactory receptor 51F2-like [Brachyhypopomus gauderio]|uniref:olfactory receptor 51F2-like n=1 Tax=Brachyhypopomus gauderio TaxID=698409 RepID=UPI00404331B2
MSVNSASAMNTTIIRPDVFYINGFYNVPHSMYYYIFLGFVYIVTVLGNSAVMCTIYVARSLHTAKYVAVFNLAFSDLCGSSALIPKIIDTFLFNNQYISYGACLANMFFVYLFMTLQSLTLVALAYDRVIAICFPLRYHVILTKTAMAINIGVVWIFSVSIVALTVALVTRVSFCSSITVTSYFCDHAPVYLLSCNGHYWNTVMAYICFYGLIGTPVIIIAISYVCIGTALLKISKWTERIKAMKTCVSHLILVAVFYLPILSTNVASMISSINPNDRIINSTLSQTIPPLLNPIIYTLKTEEFKQAIKVLCRRLKVVVMHELPQSSGQLLDPQQSVGWSKEELLALRHNSSPFSTLEFIQDPSTITEILTTGALALLGLARKRWRVRHRGRRAGALVRLRRRGFRTSLPSLFLSNLCSLHNKTEELLLLNQTNKDFSNASTLCFTETWVSDLNPDRALRVPGFRLYRADRDSDLSSKSRGGGICFYINERWSKDNTVLLTSCSPNLESIFIKCRPFYFPREISSFTLAGVYISRDAQKELADLIRKVERENRDTLLIILGDFNQANLTKELPKYRLHVSCATREENILDHCYTTIKDAYRSVACGSRTLRS